MLPTTHFAAPVNSVWSAPLPGHTDTPPPSIAPSHFVYCEHHSISLEGITFNNAFILGFLGDPSTNTTVTYRKPTGPYFLPHETEISLTQRSPWMQHNEEDAHLFLMLLQTDPVLSPLRIFEDACFQTVFQPPPIDPPL